MVRHWLIGFFAFLTCPVSGAVESVVLPGKCGTLANHYGPYDYRDHSSKEKLQTVEPYHFTPGVESLTKGQSSFKIPGDLNYTLRVFPNHHRALNSMARFDLLGMAKTTHGPLLMTPECYFLRGIAWRPDDEAVRMIYGNYLFKKGNAEGAREQYMAALAISPDSPEVNYNYGLLLVSLGDLKAAAKHAGVAYAGGYPLPGLRNKLAEAGVAIEMPVSQK